MPFAGHPTLGTAYIIKRFMAADNPARVALNLKVGQMPVSFEDDMMWMQQVPPVFGKTFEAEQLTMFLQQN